MAERTDREARERAGRRIVRGHRLNQAVAAVIEVEVEPRKGRVAARRGMVRLVVQAFRRAGEGEALAVDRDRDPDRAGRVEQVERRDAIAVGLVLLGDRIDQILDGEGVADERGVRHTEQPLVVRAGGDRPRQGEAEIGRTRRGADAQSRHHGQRNLRKFHDLPFCRDPLVAALPRDQSRYCEWHGSRGRVSR